METVIASLITAGVTLCVCMINNAFQNDKTRALMEYQIGELRKQVEKHNSLIERIYRLEETATLHEEKLKVANHRIEDLEKERKAG